MTYVYTTIPLVHFIEISPLHCRRNTWNETNTKSIVLYIVRTEEFGVDKISLPLLHGKIFHMQRVRPLSPSISGYTFTTLQPTN